MTPLPDELLESKRTSPLSPILAGASVILAILIFSVYVGNLLFGANSLEVLLHLKKHERELAHKVERLQQDNAKLQKEYFELKGLEP